VVLTKQSLNGHKPLLILVSHNRLRLAKRKSFKGWPRVADAG